jgi:hypothetical protein
VSAKRLFLRFLVGLAILALTLVVAFSLALAAIPTWGATPEEVQRVLPGDELSSDPLLKWTNSTTIAAPPEAVWPWIAQLGDTRGGFYSYTTIENRVGAITGASDYQVVYHNANTIVAEWQDPAPGDQIIQGSMRIREVRPGDYLLAEIIQPAPFGWTWLWRIYPMSGGSQTRLVVRFAIDLPGEEENPAMTFFMTIGGFVMTQKMLDGIAQRAEGGTEAPYFEKLEVALWAISLAAGLIAAGLYLFQPAWQRPLLVAVAAVLALVVLLIVQPAMTLRLFLVAALLVGLWWAYEPRGRVQEAVALAPA